jgi:eukaryotic-like serine/threonine-protein kinase
MPGSTDPPPTPRKARPLRLLAELHRRRVPRVAALYCVAAWLAMQVASVVFPALGLPAGAVTVVVVLCILGLPLAVALAWLFDITPEGDVVAGAAGGSHAPLDGAAVSRMALPMVLLLLLVAAAGWMAMDGRGAAAPEAPPAGSADTRIAVLYLDEAGDDPGASRVLAGGLTEALIADLSSIPALRVISRNGVAPYRGVAVTVDSIARALNVELLIGGTVTRAGDSVRVAVQITDARSGELLESLRLHRASGELFPLMDALVDDVSRFLRQRLGREIRVREVRRETRSVAAWETLRQAEEVRDEAYRMNARGERAVAGRLLLQADSMAAAAGRLDPGWIEPHLARGWIAQGRAAIAFDPRLRDVTAVAAALEEGVRHADAARARHREDGRPRELKGMLLYWTSLMAPPGDPAAAASLLRSAEVELRAAVAADPGLARAWSTLSSLLFGRGELGDALRAGERALAADAYLNDSENILARLFLITFERADDGAALRWCDELTTRRAGSWPAAQCSLMLMGWLEGRAPDVDAAWRVMGGVRTDALPGVVGEMRPRLEALVATVIARAGLPDSARAVLRRAEAAAPLDPELLPLAAGAYVKLGEPERAAAMLEAYYAGRPGRRAMLAASRRFAELPGQGPPEPMAPAPASPQETPPRPPTP